MQPPITIAVVTFTADQLQALIEQAVERAMRSHRPIQPVQPPEPRTAYPERMRRDQAAEYIGLTARSLGVEPVRKRLRIPYVKVGRNVIYERAALDRWLAERRVS